MDTDGVSSTTLLTDDVISESSLSERLLLLTPPSDVSVDVIPSLSSPLLPLALSFSLVRFSSCGTPVGSDKGSAMISQLMGRFERQWEYGEAAV